MIEIFLIGRNKKVKITKEVVKAAARNRQSGGEVMKVLLQERGSEIKITEEVVKAAVENKRSGAEIIKILFQERGLEMEVTEGIVKIILQIGDKEVVKFSKRGDWKSRLQRRWSRQQQGIGWAEGRRYSSFSREGIGNGSYGLLTVGFSCLFKCVTLRIRKE